MSAGHDDTPRANAAVSLRGVSVTLGGNQILRNVTLDFEAGVTSGLIGPNGAGKSTLLNYICRIIPAVSGALFILGKNADSLLPHEVLQAGLARTFQGAQFVGELTAVENVMLGFHVKAHAGLTAAALRTGAARRIETAAKDAALAAMAKVGIAHFADRQISQLPFGDQKKVDLARALVAEAPCILLDEPMAGLSTDEKTGMCRLLTELRDRGGPTIILVEHDMRVVSELCVWAAALDAGELIAQGATATVLRSKEVADAYLGGGRPQ